jgi:ribulose-bisphosphate carboxylase small chain
MRFETFSFLPPLSQAQIEAQIATAIAQGAIPAVEYAENPNTANFYWQVWPIPPAKINSTTSKPEPMTASHIATQVEACARRHPYSFVRVTAYNPKERQTILSFVAKTPQEGE